MRNSQLDISSRMERHPTLLTPAWPKFSPFSATASFRRDFGHRARPISHRLIISYGDISKGLSQQTTNHRRLEGKHHRRNSGSDSGRTDKGLSKIWRAWFNPVWTQMVATSSVCYDIVTFLTQRTYCCSNLVAISSLVLELLKKWRVW